jgi:hypothetical protein
MALYYGDDQMAGNGWGPARLKKILLSDPAALNSGTVTSTDTLVLADVSDTEAVDGVNVPKPKKLSLSSLAAWLLANMDTATTFVSGLFSFIDKQYFDTLMTHDSAADKIPVSSSTLYGEYMFESPEAVLNQAIVNASAQTTMTATNKIPVSDVTTPYTAGKHITWANFVTAMLGALSAVTQSVNGLMIAADKKKLDGHLVNNYTGAAQTGFAADQYLTGSYIKLPFTPVAGTRYRCKFDMTKTAAGVATPIITVRVGTAGTTSDASIGTMTYGAGSAAADSGVFEVDVVFRSIGASAVAILNSFVQNILASTGLTSVKKASVSISSAFNSTTANIGIGLSFNGGTSFVGTVQMVSAELIA